MHKELLREKGWLTIHDDTWNVLNMQHTTPNYPDIPIGGTVTGTESI